MCKCKTMLNKIGAILTMAVVLLGISYSPAMATYKIKQAYTRLSGTAGEAVTTGDIVCIKDADGLVWKADADSATLRPAIGVVGKGGASGATVEVITSGRLTGWSSLAEGGSAYLSTTAGAVTQTPANGWRQQIGWAVSTTDYLFSVTGDSGGVLDYLSVTAHNYGAAAADWTMTAAEAMATYITVTNASGAVNALLPAAMDGKLRVVYNNSGQVLTFKVSGGTGGTIANGKRAVYADNGTDVIEIYEQP
jgi:hypothetical protein